MPGSPDTPVVVCYISGLDQRRIHPESTPFLTRAFGEMPWVPLTNVPSNELFPTLVTGVDPTQHQVWGVKLKPSSNGRFPVRVVDYLPGWTSTTVQGLLHLATGTFDLAAIPPSRRRRFEITRTKYKRRRIHVEALYAIGGIPSIFDVIGRAGSRYIFDSGYDLVRRLLPRLASDGCLAEIVELYSLDRFQQWNLDRPDAVREFYGRMDDFLGRLHDKCRRVGKVLVIVSDHGHEPIQRSIDVFRKLRDLSVSGDEYTCFVEVSSARFWFHSKAAR